VQRSSSTAILPSVICSARKSCAATGSMVRLAHSAGVGCSDPRPCGIDWICRKSVAAASRRDAQVQTMPRRRVPARPRRRPDIFSAKHLGSLVKFWRTPPAPPAGRPDRSSRQASPPSPPGGYYHGLACWTRQPSPEGCLATVLKICAFFLSGFLSSKRKEWEEGHDGSESTFRRECL
jgi:hypothetical protein